MGEKIRVLLADDDPVAQRAIATYLARTPDLELVATAGDGVAAVQLGLQWRPDVAIVDIHMPKLGGIETTKRLTSPPISCAVICLTALGDDLTLHRALNAGASGFLMKSDSPGLIQHAIRAAHNGDALVSPRLVRQLLGSRIARNSEPPSDLTQIELRLLGHLGTGMSNAEIGVELELATSTVKGYISRLLARLELTNRTALAAKAHEWGLVVD